MDDRNMEFMMAFLRSALKGTEVPEHVRVNCTEDTVKELYTLAKRYSLDHLMAYAALKNGIPLPQETETEFRNRQFRAYANYSRQQHVLETIGALLEKEKIPFLPLKGAVLRQEYPEPWMRNSSDLDILVHPEDLERASDVLVKEAGYERKGRTGHDISLFSPEKVHIELHHCLIEEGRANNAGGILEHIWEFAEPQTEARYVLRDAMFYYYHMAHMAKHIENGGCGIRPFFDLWFLNQRVDADWPGRRKLLKQGGLTRFAEVAELLSAVWMGEAEPNEDTAVLQSFLEKGGTYGTIENHVALSAAKKDSRILHVFRRIFPPIRIMKNLYPALQKHPVLLPLMWVRRLFRLKNKERLKRSLSEVRMTSNLTDDELANARECLSRIGLR